MYNDPEKAAAMSELKPEPIGRTALAVEITNRLRQMILEGQLEPGGKINEKLLTEQFGVSRTPLREALKVLAAEGLLDLIPHRGARFLSDTRISIAPTATLVYAEILQPGRKHHHPDECFGATLLSLAGSR